MTMLRLWAVAGPVLGFYAGMAMMGLLTRVGVRAGAKAGTDLGDTADTSVRLPDGGGSWAV